MPKNLFNSVQFKKPSKNKFDLSHEIDISFNMGYLVPTYIQEILPGDHFQVQSQMFARLAPMIAPMFHQVNLYTHYFFVPSRILWEDWEDFMTGGTDGLSEPEAPYFVINQENVTNAVFNGRNLLDWMGIPVIPMATTGVTANTKISALPLRAYQQIYNDYYIDQNVVDIVNSEFPKDGGVQNSPTAMSTTLSIRRRAWEKDYFTTAQPNAQRGPQVLMPFEAVVTEAFRTATGDTNTTVGAVTLDNAGAILNATPVEIGFRGDNATATITDLRRAEAIQKWLEKAARSGARYCEQILAIFGVQPEDARLQRAEYLGGGKQPITVSEIVSTFAQDDTEPQGNMSGHGISVGQTNGFSKTFKEHGYVLGITSMLPRTKYQQGIDRMWSRESKYDYFQPDLQHIGEQEVINREIYFDPQEADTTDPADAAFNGGTFGYAPRYSEYKWQQNRSAGDFRESLAFWTMTRIFEERPVLDENFVQADPTERIFAVDDAGATDKVYLQVYNQVSAIRPMAYYGTPSLT